MPEDEFIAYQHELLATHRRTLAHLLRQAAQHGGEMFAPVVTANGIYEAREQIRRIKITLRGWSVPIEDLPTDEDPASTHHTPVTSPKVEAALEALIELMQASEVRSAVAVYRVSFESICQQIALLGTYKTLHDLLQQLADRVAILTRCCKALPNDQAAWNDVEINEPDLYAKIDELLEFVNQDSFVNEAALWTPKLVRSQRDLRAALESYAADWIKNALGRLREVVERQLSRANTHLVDVAATLHLETLVQALRQICDQLVRASLGEAAASRLHDLQQGIEALAELDERLKRCVALHTAFQEFDDELRRVEGLLDHGLTELVESWQDLGPMTRALCSGGTAAWIARLSALADELEVALIATDALRLRRAFSRYRSYATVCFNRVDHDLRALCTALHQVGSPLDRALRIVE